MAALKVMPPISFHWPTALEADVGSMAAEVEPSHPSHYTLLPCDRWQQRGRLQERKEKKMASDMEVRMKQRCVIEFLHAERIAPIDIHRRLLNVYGDLTVDVSTVRRWVVRFSRGDGDVKDKPRSGRPCTAVTARKECLEQLICTDRPMVGSLKATVVSKGQCAPTPLLQPPKAAQPKDKEGQETPGNPQTDDVGVETPDTPQGPLGTEGPDLSPPCLEPQVSETPKDANVELGNASHEPAATGAKRRRRANPPDEEVEEKFVPKLLVKRQPSGGPVLRKVPRVSLERLELDLSGEAQPPVFRVFPGTSSEEFSLIVIERGAQPQPAPPPPPAIKEEQKELSIEDAKDTKPVLLPPEPPSGVVTGLEIPPAPTVAPPGTHRNVSCCRVCCQAGAVVMCDLCERCYHLDCHLPVLHVVPSHDWRCLLCQDPPPPTEGLTNGGPDEGQLPTLSPTDQQKCERVLLELLCHEPCRPLHRLSSSTESSDAIDLTLIRAKLQGKLSPTYTSPEEFAADIARMIRQFNRLTEDKADVQSILGVQRFFQEQLRAAFSNISFSTLLDPSMPSEGAESNAAAPPAPLPAPPVAP